MKTQVFDQLGAKKKDVTLSDSVWGADWKPDLVHQVVVSMMSNKRRGTAHTKDRSEVRGTGKKPWRQKGTGRARHGSRRSPIWAGGGVTFGPRNEKDWSKKINRKMRIRSLVSALSRQANDKHVVMIEGIELKEPKTSIAAEIIKSLGKVEGFETINTTSNSNNVLLIVPVATDTMKRAFKNLPHVDVKEARLINTVDIANHRYIVVSDPEAVTDVIEARLNQNNKQSNQ